MTWPHVNFRLFFDPYLSPLHVINPLWFCSLFCFLCFVFINLVTQLLILLRFILYTPNEPVFKPLVNWPPPLPPWGHPCYASTLLNCIIINIYVQHKQPYLCSVYGSYCLETYMQGVWMAHVIVLTVVVTYDLLNIRCCHITLPTIPVKYSAPLWDINRLKEMYRNWLPRYISKKNKK